jgi:hypothetical protein
MPGCGWLIWINATILRGSGTGGLAGFPVLHKLSSSPTQVGALGGLEESSEQGCRTGPRALRQVSFGNAV